MGFKSPGMYMFIANFGWTRIPRLSGVECFDTVKPFLGCHSKQSKDRPEDIQLNHTIIQSFIHPFPFRPFVFSCHRTFALSFFRQLASSRFLTFLRVFTLPGDEGKRLAFTTNPNPIKKTASREYPESGFCFITDERFKLPSIG